MSKKKEQTKGEVRPKKHLSQDERITIQTMLDNSAKPYEIAQTLNKSPSTIIREIRNHTKIVPENQRLQEVVHLRKTKDLYSYIL